MSGGISERNETEKFLWGHEATCNLIQLYKKYPALYASVNCDYKNKAKRLEALKSIKDEMVRRGWQTTIEDIKRKIHGLRTQYAHQLSKMKKGAAGEEVKPTLWCFNQLDFLRTSYEGQPGMENECIHESKDLGHFNVLEENDNEDSREMASLYDDVRLIKRESTFTASIPETPAFASVSDVGKNERKEDDLSTFGKLVELELRKITRPRALRKVKKDIIIALMDAQDACDD